MLPRSPIAVFAAAAVLCLGLLEPASANFAEQRRRLPPPAEGCGDDPAGVWRAHQYFPDRGLWSIFTVTLRRGESGERTGEATTRYWNGRPDEEQPPPCRPGLVHRAITTPMQWSVEGDQLHFWSTEMGTEEVQCGGPSGGWEIGGTRGTLDATRNEFTSVFDTGQSWREVPTLYRRISCADGSAAQPFAPPPSPTPPPAPPPAETSSGCGCLW